MDNPDQRVGKYKGVISAAAYRFRNAAEYDDLYQEGMIAVWLCPPDADDPYVSKAIYNRMKMWVRFVKRLRHNHSVSYEEIVDGVYNGDSGEPTEELL
jgi:DNA-directed RNA polymerase specialized sigma24 family protein